MPTVFHYAPVNEYFWLLTIISVTPTYACAHFISIASPATDVDFDGNNCTAAYLTLLSTARRTFRNNILIMLRLTKAFDVQYSLVAKLRTTMDHPPLVDEQYNIPVKFQVFQKIPELFAGPRLLHEHNNTGA